MERQGKNYMRLHSSDLLMPSHKKEDLYNLNKYADHKFNIAYTMQFVFDRKETHVEKRECWSPAISSISVSVFN